MMGFLNKDRQTIDFDLDAQICFGSKLAHGLLDWFKILEKHKMERVKRAVILNTQKKKPRTIVDMLGTQDFEEYKEEIDLEMKRVQYQQQSMSTCLLYTSPSPRD